MFLTQARSAVQWAFLKAYHLVFKRTIILILAAILLSNWLVDLDRMKLKTLNRVVPASMEDLVAFDRNPHGPTTIALENYILYFKTAASVLTSSSAAHAMLGYAYYYSGDFKRAAVFYRKAIKLTPEFFWFQHDLGAIYLKQGRYKEAAEVLEKALACRPEDALIFLNVSKIYRELNRYASDFGYDTEKGLLDGYRNAHEMLMICYVHLKKYRQCLFLIENSSRLHLHPEEVLHYYSGLIAYELKEYQQAAAFFQLSIKENPTSRKAYYYLALTLKALGDDKPAQAIGPQNLVGLDGFGDLEKNTYDVHIF